MLGIVDAGQLDEDAILPLALDRRLLGAGLVDAAADDLDRLLDGLAAARLGRDRAELHRAGAIGRNFHDEVRVVLGESAFRLLDAVGVADRKGDRVAFDIEAGISDMGIAQCIADAVGNRVEALALRRIDIDVKQEIGAAAQVEAERDLLFRDEMRQIAELRGGEQVRQAQQHAEQAGPADQQNFPVGEIQHAFNAPKRPLAQPWPLTPCRLWPLPSPWPLRAPRPGLVSPARW